MVRDARGRLHEPKGIPTGGQYASGGNGHGVTDDLPPLPGMEEPAAPPEPRERIVTLLADRLPLREDRKGKVPAVGPDEDSVRIQSKLAKYLNDNFEGDRDQANKQAIENLWGEAHVLDDACDFGVNPRLTGEAREKSVNACRSLVDMETALLKERTNSEVRTYWDGTRVVFVTDARKAGVTNKPTASFTRNGLKVRVVDFGDLQACDQVIDRMGLMDPDVRRRAIIGLLDNDRRNLLVANLSRPAGLANAHMYAASGVWDRMCARAGVENEPYSMPGGEGDFEAHAPALEEYLEHTKANLEQIGCIKDAKQAGGHLADVRSRDLPEQYRTTVLAMLRDETDSERNKAFAKRARTAHSATVEEDKRNRDPEHDRAGRESEFAKDFDRIEVDDSVDLGKFRRLGAEYARYKSLMPREKVRATLRFRMTGRHRATGVYSTDAHGLHNIAVDPRHPSSFTHEYFHHLDFTNDPKGRQVSMDPDFRRIVDHYQATVDRSRISGDPDRYLAPTEIFARAGELWMSERAKGSQSSFLDTPDAYAGQFDYQPLNDMKDEVMAFMDRHFA